MKNKNLSKLIDSLIFDIKKISKKISEPVFNNSEIKLLTSGIKQNSVSTYGRQVQIFENMASKFLNTKNAIAISSGTSALHMALYALKVDNKCEILLPSTTFVATANSILYCNATPHFIDISLEDLNIDTAKLENYLKRITIVKNNKCFNKFTKKIIRAIIPVHLYGNSANLNEIIRISKKFKFDVVEDAAEAFGTKYNGRNVGTFGKIGIFSFNGNKLITTGAGGLIVTKNKVIEKKIRHLISQSKIKKKFDIYSNELGFNLKMNALCASLGIAQLKKIKKILKSKRKIFNYYKSKFKHSSEIKLICSKEKQIPNHWINTIMFKNINKKKKEIIF